MSTYRTAPDHEDKGWPKGVPYIIGNEGCERFSYYGMKAILFVYLMALLQQTGLTAQLAEKEATHVFHIFGAGVYALPMVGALIADRWWGKYRTIMWLSVVYCGGHACLAIFDGNWRGTMLGLALICLGSGGIKPCVSANVGDQFGRSNWFRVERVYQAFYFIINFGSALSTFLIPWIKGTWGFSVAFAVPGILMGIATIWFWAGRKAFVHAPPKPGGMVGFVDVLAGVLLFMVIAMPMFGAEVFSAYAGLGVVGRIVVSLVFLAAGLTAFGLRQRMQPDDGFLSVLTYAIRTYLTKRELEPLPAADKDHVGAVGADVAGNLRSHSFWGPAARRFGQEAAEGPIAILRIISVFAMVSVFWALFEQHGSTWVAQAKEMNRVFDLGLFKFEMMPEQISMANPVFVMVLVPLMGFGVYPFVRNVLKIDFTPLRRMTVGMFLTSLSFAIVALAQARIDAGADVHIGWQILAYVVITIGEVMVSVTGLEFAYTQAPRRMKSLIMGFWLLSVAAGNLMVAYAAMFKDLPRVDFFWLFAGLMFLATLVFGARAYFYQYKSYTQG